ncbi:hypothetical protein I5M27_14495 [Adhaeribacter sp. BT258]|uniref:Uncharacterized protein n=1 Tax=Adhaeribacter terrigena TaxID=2793070 RepID=A0ABS1C469_9BACT|nr:hypothetical protein [Adhaeribacter terrigena]MBK0404202.1 hypothetical protein [Adhaeribacter terrigena]
MKRFLFFAFGLLLTSCVSPYNISKISPTEENTNWAWGREFVHKTVDSVVVKIAYETNDRNNAIFNVEVENNSSRPVLVAPERFWSNMSGANLPQSIVQQQKAVDPESYYLDLAKQKSRQEAEEMNTAISHVTLSLLETTSAVASIADKETPEEREQRQQMRDESAHNREIDLYRLENKRISLNDRKRFLDQTILRKSTLPPNSVIYGEVYFQRHDQATSYEINIPINDKLLKFHFKQQIVRP